MSSPTVAECHRYLLDHGWLKDPLTDTEISVYTRDDARDDDGDALLLHLPTTTQEDDARFVEKLIRLLSLFEGRPEPSVAEAIVSGGRPRRVIADNPRLARRFPNLGLQ